MPVTERNLEQLINLITAYMGRFQEIQDLAVQLRRPAFWRSPDGTLEVGALSADDKTRLRERITKDLDEAEIVIATVRGLLAEGGGS